MNVMLTRFGVTVMAYWVNGVIYICVEGTGTAAIAAPVLPATPPAKPDVPVIDLFEEFWGQWVLSIQYYGVAPIKRHSDDRGVTWL